MAAPTTPAQKGTTYKTTAAPSFTGFTVKDKAEIAKKFQKVTETPGPGGKVENITGWDYTKEWDPELIVHTGTTIPEVFDVLTDSGGSKWLVLEASEIYEHQGHDMVKLKLKFFEGITLN